MELDSVEETLLLCLLVVVVEGRIYASCCRRPNFFFGSTLPTRQGKRKGSADICIRYFDISQMKEGVAV